MWPFRKRELSPADKIGRAILENWHEVEVLGGSDEDAYTRYCLIRFRGEQIDISHVDEHGVGWIYWKIIKPAYRHRHQGVVSMTYVRKYLNDAECGAKGWHSRNHWKAQRVSIPLGTEPKGTLRRPYRSQRIPVFSADQGLPMKPKRFRAGDLPAFTPLPPKLSTEDNAILGSFKL